VDRRFRNATSKEIKCNKKIHAFNEELPQLPLETLLIEMQIWLKSGEIACAKGPNMP
jgi:hypothetical protein